MKDRKAALRFKIADPWSGPLSEIKPPGTPMPAANVTVAVRVANVSYNMFAKPDTMFVILKLKDSNMDQLHSNLCFTSTFTIAFLLTFSKATFKCYPTKLSMQIKIINPKHNFTSSTIPSSTEPNSMLSSISEVGF